MGDAMRALDVRFAELCGTDGISDSPDKQFIVRCNILDISPQTPVLTLSMRWQDT